MKKFFLIMLLSLSCSLSAKTVVFVHGFLEGNTSTFHLMEKVFRRAGCDIYPFQYNSLRHNIRHHATDLACFLREVADYIEDDEINYVCHSLGAIVLRAALNDPSCPQKAKRGKAALFSPPNRGSSFGRQFEELAPYLKCMGFEIMAELVSYTEEDIQALGPYPDSLDILILAGTKGVHVGIEGQNDGIVTLCETGLNRPFYFQAFPTTHGKIVTYRPAIALARTFICCGFCDEKEKEKDSPDKEPEEPSKDSSKDVEDSSLKG